MLNKKHEKKKNKAQRTNKQIKVYNKKKKKTFPLLKLESKRQQSKSNIVADKSYFSHKPQIRNTINNYGRRNFD